MILSWGRWWPGLTESGFTDRCRQYFVNPILYNQMDRIIRTLLNVTEFSSKSPQISVVYYSSEEVLWFFERTAVLWCISSLDVGSCCPSIPELLQPPSWTLQSSRQQLDSWLSWMIVAQVQLSQMGGVGVQSRGQRSTSFLCDQTSWHTEMKKVESTQCSRDSWDKNHLQMKNIFTNRNLKKMIRISKTNSLTGSSILTWVSPADSVDSPVQQTAASLLNPAGRCYSGPDVSDWRTESWELRTEPHNFSLTADSHSACERTNNETRCCS